MPKFLLNAKVVIEAGSSEEALSIFADHVKTVARHHGNGVKVDGQFQLTPADRDATPTDLSDKVVADKGPHALTLDPESDEGKAHEVQKAEQAEAAEAERQAKEKDLRTDAENLDLHSKNEQAELNRAIAEQ